MLVDCTGCGITKDTAALRALAHFAGLLRYMFAGFFLGIFLLDCGLLLAFFLMACCICWLFLLVKGGWGAIREECKSGSAFDAQHWLLG